LSANRNPDSGVVKRDKKGRKKQKRGMGGGGKQTGGGKDQPDEHYLTMQRKTEHFLCPFLTLPQRQEKEKTTVQIIKLSFLFQHTLS
jgi:hypothetical protein